MTTDDRFGHNLSAWLREDGEHRVPDHLAEVLVQTVATRQRPWWSSPERWLPVDTAFRPRFFNIPRPGRLLLVAGLILVLLALAIAAIGSRPRVPEPFGLARNGTFVESRDGDIFAIDPVTSNETLLVGGAPFDFGGYFSRDGSKFVFLRSDGPVTDPAILAMYVANTDGSGVRALTPPTESLDWLDWSPDGTRIAYMADGKVYVVDVDGGEPRRLVGTGPAHFPTWLPPDGTDLIYRLETASPGIWAIASDGTGKRRLLSKTPPNNEFDYQSIAVSPDGSHITFNRWASDAVSRVYGMEVATGEEIAFPTPAGTSQRGTAIYSPDGSSVAYARIYPEGAFQIVVADADGTGNERTFGPKRPAPTDGSGLDAYWAFTPDGTALVVRYGTDVDGTTKLMPLDGSPATDLGSGGFEFVDVQRLAR